MFIALIGPRSSGKNTIKEYLVNKGFATLALDPHGVDQWYANKKPPKSSTLQADPPKTDGNGVLTFPSPPALLEYITTRWAADFVTTALNTRDLVALCSRRPAFLLVRVDAPLGLRFTRSGGKANMDLEQFMEEDDHIEFGSASGGWEQAEKKGLRALRRVVHVHISNIYPTAVQLHAHLDAINLLDPERLRPGWDTYFMTLASLASHRSNCMKRRVGAVLVRERRIVSTGYNGTPRWLTNCNAGGCGPCNGRPDAVGRECICLHAEENALTEAGRERVGAGAVLYCDTCPCERCTIKIIQSGVKEVVYNLEYKVDKYSAVLFVEAGVLLRKHAPPVDY